MNGITVVTLLDDLLDSAVAELSNPPSRQFIAHGDWAKDCECVAVEVTDASVSNIDPAQCAGVDSLSLAVTVVRCYIATTTNAPVPAASGIGADAYTHAFDLGELVGGLGDRWAAGTLFPSVAGIGCGQVQFLGAIAGGPEGGYAWWTVNLSVEP